MGPFTKENGLRGCDKELASLLLQMVTSIFHTLPFVLSTFLFPAVLIRCEYYFYRSLDTMGSGTIMKLKEWVQSSMFHLSSFSYFSGWGFKSDRFFKLFFYLNSFYLDY